MYRSNGICVGLIAWIYLTTLGDVVLGQSFGSNAVALLNGQASLDCMYASLATSQWSQTPDGTSNNLLIAAGCSVSGSNAAYYRTVQPGGNICRLIIANVTMQQGGVYTCWDGIGVSYRSLVTVIDPHARVEVYNQSEVVDNDQLNISCSINYNGPSSPAPSLRPSPYWTTSPGQIFTSAIYHPSTTLATLVATVRVQKPTVPIFHCYTAFEITGNSSIYNLTAPADNFAVGNSTQMDVEYKPSEIYILHTSANLTKGFIFCGINRLTCHVTANPTPLYEWFDATNSVDIQLVSDNEEFDVAESNRTYNCTAYNYIRGIKNVVSSTYNVIGSYASSPCKFPHNSAMKITAEGATCEGRKCSCVDEQPVYLTCAVDTFPIASYQWNMDDKVLTRGSLYTAIYNGIYICIASSNVVNVATRSVTLVDCKIPPDADGTDHPTSDNAPSQESTNVAGVVLGVVLGLSLGGNVALICLILHWRRTVKANSSRNTSDKTVKSYNNPASSADDSTVVDYEGLHPTENRDQPTTYSHLTPITRDEITANETDLNNSISEHLQINLF